MIFQLHWHKNSVKLKTTLILKNYIASSSACTELETIVMDWLGKVIGPLSKQWIGLPPHENSNKRKPGRPKGSRNKPKTSSAAAARELEEAKKYLQKPIRGPGRFLPIAMAAAGLGAGWYYLKKRQKSSVADGIFSDSVAVPEDSKKIDAKNVNNTIKKPIDHTHDRPF